MGTDPKTGLGHPYYMAMETAALVCNLPFLGF